MRRKVKLATVLPFWAGGIALIAGLCLVDHAAIAAFRDAAFDSETADRALWLGSPVAWRLAVGMMAVLFGGVMVTAAPVGWLASLPLLPLGIFNRLLTPLRDPGCRSRVRWCYAVMACALLFLATRGLWIPGQLGQWAAQYYPETLGRWIPRDQWFQIWSRYGPQGCLVLIGLSCGMGMTAILSWVEHARRQKSNLEIRGGYHGPSLRLKTPDLCAGDAGFSAVPRRLEGERIPRRLRQWERAWTEPLRSRGFSTHGWWQFTDSDGVVGHTVTRMGCEGAVILELSRIGRCERATLTTVLDDGMMLRTVGEDDPRAGNGRIGEQIQAADPGHQADRWLTKHLGWIAQHAELRNARVTDLYRQDMKWILTHGGFPSTLSERPVTPKYVAATQITPATS